MDDQLPALFRDSSAKSTYQSIGVKSNEHKKKRPQNQILYAVTHSFSDLCQQRFTLVRSASTWLITIGDFDDDETQPNFCRGLPVASHVIRPEILINYEFS